MVLATVARQEFQLLRYHVESLKKGRVEFVYVMSIQLVLEATQARSAGNAVLTDCCEKSRGLARRLVVIECLVAGVQSEQALFEHRPCADKRIVP